MAPRKENVLQVRCDDAFVAQVDDWRRTQPDIPSRAEAIRRLVELALKGTDDLKS